MNIENDSNQFMRSLPRGPLVQHLGALHALAVWLPHTESPEVVRETMHYHLREIARYTAEPEGYPYHRPPASAGTHDAPAVFDVRGSDMAAAMRQAAQSLGRNIANLRKNLRDAREARDAALSPEQRDRVSEARYRRAVAAERRTGLAFVAAEGARVRKELGL